MLKRQGIPARFRLAEELRRNQVNEQTGPMNLLSLMFRQVRSDLNISSLFWANRMTQYLKDPRNAVLQTSRGKSSERSNLNRGLIQPEMTILNFVRGLRVIRPINVKFMLMIEHRDGTKSAHSEEMDENDLYTEYHNEKYPTRLNVLHRLFLDIQKYSIKNEDDWNEKIKRYLDDPANGFMETGRNQSSERSNLNRGLKNPDMSIKIFTKGLKVVDPVRVYFTLELTFHPEHVTLHEVRMDGRFLNIHGDDDHNE